MAADDKFAALERLARLKADGIITDAEFAAEKAAVLAGRITAPAPPPPQVYTPPPPPPSAPPTIIYAQPPQARGWVGRAIRGAFVGLLVFIIIAVIGARSHGGSAGAAMVTCDSQDARDVLKDAFEHSVADRVTNVRLLDVANIVERSYDPAKAQRICAADVTFNTGEQHVGYKLYKSSNGQDLLLQTMDDPGPSSAPPANTAASPAASAQKHGDAGTTTTSGVDMTKFNKLPEIQQEMIKGIAQVLTSPRPRLPCVRNPGVPAESAQALTCVNQGQRYTMPASIAGVQTSYRLVDRLPYETSPGQAAAPWQQP